MAPGPINGGNPVSVGQTNVTAKYQIQNTSSTPEDTGTVTLQNGAAPNGIRETLSCATDANSPCLAGDLDTVFAVVNLGSAASGVGSSACAGQTFTITADVTTGEIIFTPDSGGAQVILGPPGSTGSGPGLNDTCVITFAVNVLKVPSVDSGPGTGIQTDQLGRVRGIASVDGLSGTGTGSGITTVNPATPPVTTQSSTNGTVVPGGSVSDTVTVAPVGPGPTPTGTVTFFLCNPTQLTSGQCPTGGTQIGTVKTLVSGSATSDAASGATTTTTGTYCWRAEYSGDANYTAASHTDGGLECFTVQPLTPSVTTLSSPTGGPVLPGTSASDTATVSGTGPTPTGSVTFFLCDPTTSSPVTGCPSGGTQIGTPKTLVNGVATSDSTTSTTKAGLYCWRAEYSGDANYNSAKDTDATNECFTVSKLPSSTTTQSNPSNTDVQAGSSVSDSATVSGTGPTPTGTVTFFLCGPAQVTSAGCPTGGTQVGTSKTLSNGSATSDSTNNTNTPGKYCWRAEYSGDTTYTGSSHTDAIAECFNVPGPSISTLPDPVTGHVGDVLNDSATLSGPIPAGTLLFSLFPPEDQSCSGTPVFTATVNVTGPGTFSTTNAVSTTGDNTATELGTYHWSAVFTPTGGGSQLIANCDEPVVIEGTPVPTLSEWGTLVMVGLLLGAALLTLRRRRGGNIVA
ncbi:MAG TPA: IPTL-CTERM sorting domain-containing protein [Candidatus Methylomirabilis sp.]|nr:IPTL-CTERM sorting domain-containing protein [Candidatus Methylomirabilis sp.]